MFQDKRKKDEDDILDTGVNNYPNLGSKDTVKRLAEDYVNYNYDTFTEGDSYKALEKRYQAGGQKAMQDTVGQVSARTGGLASSYATVAGQQTYNDWMGNLEDAARALYDSEKQEMGDRYAIANSMYLQDRDEERYVDERDYSRSESSRLEGEGKAYDTVVALINAGTPIDEIDSELIAKTGYGSGYWKAYATNNTKATNKDKLQDLMDIMDRGGTVTLQQWKDAGGLDDDYDMYASIGANADAEELVASYISSMLNGVLIDKKTFTDAGGSEAVYDVYKAIYDKSASKDAATLATNTLNTLIKTKADVDWDSEEIQQLIKDSGRSALEWNALIAQAQEEAQADADAEAAEEIATAEANAANDVIMYLVGGTKTLDELEAEGLLASTGRGSDWWEGYIAYQNKLNPQEVEEVAKFYEVNYETAKGYMAYMDEITTQNEAIDFKELVASATGNQKFADELYMRWLTKHSDITVS